MPEHKAGDRYFEKVTTVYLVEIEDQRDEPPGRAPTVERRTVLAEDRSALLAQEVSRTIGEVLA